MNKNLFNRDSSSQVFIFFLLIQIFLLFSSSRNDSAVMDEVFHIRDGYHLLNGGKWRWDPPPLVRLLGGFLPSLVNLTDSKDPLSHKNDLDWVLFLARLPLILLFPCFGVLFFILLKYYFDPRIALAGSLFLLFEPNLMAHSRYVTTDFPVTVLFTILLFLVSVKVKPAIFFPAMGLILITGLMTKFTFGFSFFFLFVLFLRKFWKTFFLGFFPRTPYFIEFYLFILMIGGLISLFFFGISHPFFVENLQPSQGSYSSGLWNRLKSFNRGDRLPQYFFGGFHKNGADFYFLICLLFKSTIGMIVFLVPGLVLLTENKVKGELDSEPFLIFPILYMLVASFFGMNLGIRHILPIFPSLIVTGCVFFQKILERPKIPGKSPLTPLLLVGFLPLFHFLESTSIYPHYISFFNLLVGPERGHFFLSDSNIDWGQDLKRLKISLRTNPLPDPIYLDYFGGGDPKYYFRDKITLWSLHQGLPKSGILVVSIHHFIQSLYWKKIGVFKEDYSPFFLKKIPIRKIGHTLYLYKCQPD